MHVRWEYPRSASLFPIGWCTISFCVFTIDVQDHLIKMVSPRLLHCKVTFSFGITQYLVGKYLEITQISSFSLNFKYIIYSKTLCQVNCLHRQLPHSAQALTIYVGQILLCGYLRALLEFCQPHFRTDKRGQTCARNLGSFMIFMC